MCSGARAKEGADLAEAQEPPARQSPRRQSQIGLAPAPVLGRIARRGAAGRSAGAGAAAPPGFLQLRSRPARASNGRGNGRRAALRGLAAARIQRAWAAAGRRALTVVVKHSSPWPRGRAPSAGLRCAAGSAPSITAARPQHRSRSRRLVCGLARCGSCACRCATTAALPGHLWVAAALCFYRTPRICGGSTAPSAAAAQRRSLLSSSQHDSSIRADGYRRIEIVESSRCEAGCVQNALGTQPK